MALSIRNPETERAVRTLAELTGLGLTEAVDMAVRTALASRDTSEAATARRRARVEDMSIWLQTHVDTDAILDGDDLYDATGLPR